MELGRATNIMSRCKTANHSWKMAGAVDLVLNDQSVSRLHARISRDGNRFFITDLNSTNGTFRNGMRLEPNASEIIEPGDEIGIGKLKFIYR